ncbi:hypothetical protein FA13DRAFT_1802500 [Coprinellus micaceus]|uniref:Uncharacterized protein n=1 Tax=Coprinellus micaceus TaxID=71717 RepID=A0A4Y7SC12_COPMI|nr:hypothetical protein FA13DRAFT_1802500 [Coprinellus micaceus]
MSSTHGQIGLDGLYTIAPSSSPSPSAHANPSTPSQSGGFGEDSVYSHMYILQNALRSTDLAVKNKALEALQRFISEMHHVIKDLKKDRANAQARLVNIAASSQGKRLRDNQHGGSGALLLPEDATALASVLKGQALTLGNIWTVLHSLHAPAYLCGTAPPVGWDWTDHVLRNRDDRNRMLGNVSELFSCAPEPVHQYILRAEDPFKRHFFKTCGNVRATIISRCVTAAATLLIDFRDGIDHSVDDEEQRRGAPLRFQDEAGVSRPLRFGDALFNRGTEGRDQIPAMRRLIGLASDSPTRWADCLYDDGVCGPGKVPFGNQCLLDIASIMIYGQKAPQTRKLVLRSDSQLAPQKDSLETTPSLIANAAGVAPYLMSANKEFVNSGVGSVSRIHYAEDIQEYKYFLTKNWEHPQIQVIVQRWNQRLFPHKRIGGDRGQEEDFTEELEAATANLNLDDSADALMDTLHAAPPSQPSDHVPASTQGGVSCNPTGFV